MPVRTEEDVKAEFGNKLRALRIGAGLSQEQLAELAELDRTYISSAERGRRNVSLEAITQLARALKISARDFFDPVPTLTKKPKVGAR
jgi:transcriptional regulator with XRE-family HTH domain